MSEEKPDTLGGRSDGRQSKPVKGRIETGQAGQAIDRQPSDNTIDGSEDFKLSRLASRRGFEPLLPP